MRSKFAVISGMMLIVLLLAACAQAPATTGAEVSTGTEARQFKIGMANFSQCCAYFIGMNKAVIAEAGSYAMSRSSAPMPMAMPPS